MKVTEYRKNVDFSYTLGVYPTIELLQTKPKTVRHVFLSTNSGKNQGLHIVKDLCKKHNIKIDITDKMVGRLGKAENIYCVAIFNKYEEQLTPGKNHLMLVNPSDMGNMGTIIRTMIGYGIEDLAIIKPGADIFNPKVVRGSMGAMFKIRFEYFNTVDDYIEKHKNNLYFFTLNSKTNLSSAVFEKPYTLAFGNEGEGLDEKIVTHYGKSVRIEQGNGIDSLNLSVATGIALYTAFKQK